MKKQKDERINLILKLMMALLFILGVLVFSYPFVVDSINNYYDQKAIEKLHKENQEEFKTKKTERLEEMKELNKKLAENKNTQNIPGMGIVEDPFEAALTSKRTKKDQEYYKEHTIGAIFIPKIHVSLPLFDETNNTLLDVGATILQGSSYPIGGKDSHSVITGHSGLPDKKLFTDLEKLEKEDVIYIDVAGEKLAYEIETFKTVLPHELDDVKIQKGRDLITLVTCTPYMINTHRLLVTAHRIPYVEEKMEKEKEQVQEYHKNRFRLFMLFFPILFSMIFYWMWRKFVYYQSGKYKYDFIFYIQKNNKPVVGETFVLTTGKNIVQNNKRKVTTTSDINGEVRFSGIRGGKYTARHSKLKEVNAVRGYVYLLKDKQFVIRGKRKYFKVIKSKDGKNYILEMRKKK